MPVKVVFKCEFCESRARGGDTEGAGGPAAGAALRHVPRRRARALARLARRGLYGNTRYSCGNHRGELKATLREHYGTIGPHPWAMGPHPVTVYRRGRLQVRERVGPGWEGRGFGPTV